MNEHSIRHASTLIKTRYALQYNLNNNNQGVGLGATAHITLLSFYVFARWGVAWCGHLRNLLP
jgi:hypothetical protein